MFLVLIIAFAANHGQSNVREHALLQRSSGADEVNCRTRSASRWQTNWPTKRMAIYGARTNSRRWRGTCERAICSGLKLATRAPCRAYGLPTPPAQRSAASALRSQRPIQRRARPSLHNFARLAPPSGCERAGNRRWSTWSGRRIAGLERYARHGKRASTRSSRLVLCSSLQGEDTTRAIPGAARPPWLEPRA